MAWHLWKDKIDFLLNNGFREKTIKAWLKSVRGFEWFMKTPLETMKEIRKVLSQFRLAPAFPVVIGAHMRGNIKEKEPEQLTEKLKEIFAYGALYYPGRREKLKMFLIKHPHLLTMPLPTFKATLAKNNPTITRLIKLTVNRAQKAGFSPEEIFEIMRRRCQRGKDVASVYLGIEKMLARGRTRIGKRNPKAKSRRKPR